MSSKSSTPTSANALPLWPSEISPKSASAVSHVSAVSERPSERSANTCLGHLACVVCPGAAPELSAVSEKQLALEVNDLVATGVVPSHYRDRDREHASNKRSLVYYESACSFRRVRFDCNEVKTVADVCSLISHLSNTDVTELWLIEDGCPMRPFGKAKVWDLNAGERVFSSEAVARAFMKLSAGPGRVGTEVDAAVSKTPHSRRRATKRARSECAELDEESPSTKLARVSIAASQAAATAEDWASIYNAFKLWRVDRDAGYPQLQDVQHVPVWQQCDPARDGEQAVQVAVSEFVSRLLTPPLRVGAGTAYESRTFGLHGTTSAAVHDSVQQPRLAIKVQPPGTCAVWRYRGPDVIGILDSMLDRVPEAFLILTDSISGFIFRASRVDHGDGTVSNSSAVTRPFDLDAEDGQGEFARAVRHVVNLIAATAVPAGYACTSIVRQPLLQVLLERLGDGGDSDNENENDDGSFQLASGGDQHEDHGWVYFGPED